VQLLLPKVAEPRGHCKQLAEPATEIDPFGHVIQSVLKTEKSFGFAVFTGHLEHAGLFIGVQRESK
jgi:hypothetical protein